MRETVGRGKGETERRRRRRRRWEGRGGERERKTDIMKEKQPNAFEVLVPDHRQAQWNAYTSVP